jgi:hypothetical protein
MGRKCITGFYGAALRASVRCWLKRGAIGGHERSDLTIGCFGLPVSSARDDSRAPPNGAKVSVVSLGMPRGWVGGKVSTHEEKHPDARRP